jgi:hypothetical protein
MRRIFHFLLWLWAAVGVLLGAYVIASMSGQMAILLPFFTFMALLWLGGLLLLGGAALLCRQDYELTRP